MNLKTKVFTLYTDGSFVADNMTEAEINEAKKQTKNFDPKKGDILVANWIYVFKGTPLREFETFEQARIWMIDEELVEEDCFDNVRFAYRDNAESMERYKQLEKNGCCGFFDEDIIVNGKQAVIGCNFGH